MASAGPEGQLGTADNPYLGPEPNGVRASQLVNVVSETYGETALVELVGDGSFSFSAFQLEEPARFVMDLPGVVKTTDQGRVPVDHGIVAQVRLAQFRSDPEPVSRIVFDLLQPAVPRIEPTPEGLAVSFDPDSLVASFPTEDVGERVAEVAGEPVGEEPVEELVIAAEPTVIEEPEVETYTAEPVVLSGTAADDLEELGYESVPADQVAAIEPEPEPERIADLQPVAEPVFEEMTVEAPIAQQPMETVAVGEEILDVEPSAEEPLVAEAAGIVADLEKAAEEPVQVAAAAPQEIEPMPAEEVVVEPMPEPELPAQTTAPVVEPQDTAMFDVANVQVEEPSSGGGASDAAASFEAQDVSQAKRYQGAPMDLTLQDADVKDVLRSFAQLSGLNMVIQPGVSGRVTVELVQVPWDQALEQILKINDLGYELDGNIMRIAPIRKLREEAEEQQRLAAARALSVPLSTVIRRVSYSQANDVANVLRARGGVMSSRGTVIVDRRTNTLIIKELPAFMNTVIAIIENLDIPEPQVMIEARIIETTKRFSRSLGVEWGFQGIASAATGNETGLEFPANGTVDGGVQLLTGAQNGFINLSLGNILSTFQLDATLNAAESEGLINILSAPKVATLNNERASIQSGLQIPIQTVANNTVSVQFVNATLRLDVTPQVTAEGTVLMDINIQKREPQLAFAVVGATNAPISTKEARTRVIVRDGGTTVIGGIYEVSTDQGEDRVPGLANVPVIKHLFKNQRRSDENEELLIFITPRVTKL
jgi:type IV pilus assembly protein PilQ